MENPLIELAAWWDAAAPEDGYDHTRLTEFQASEEVYRLGFETMDDAGEKASWTLEVADAEEIAWHGVWGEPEWFADHPLLFPHRSTGALVSIARPLVDPLRAWGAVAKAHHALAGGWFPLERFFRTGLLDSRFGELALGPAPLLEVYADALRSVGEDIGYAPLVGRSLEDSGFRVLTWGKSYFVARSFSLTRIT